MVPIEITDEADKIIYELLDEVKQVAVLFKDVHQYLRKRKECPSVEKYNNGIKLLDKVQLNAATYISDKYGEN